MYTPDKLDNLGGDSDLTPLEFFPSRSSWAGSLLTTPQALPTLADKIITITILPQKGDIPLRDWTLWAGFLLFVTKALT